MISIERAVELILNTAAENRRPDRMPAESVSLIESVHRILREDIGADADSPPFDKSIRDGFAVRHEDLQAIPAVLRVIGEARAGKSAAVQVVPGTCCEIMTGAPLPAGADAVVMVEHSVRVSPETVRILRKVEAGTGLLRRGAESRAGEQLLTTGRRIELTDIGLLASVGKAGVQVSRKPLVAIVATGDELVGVEDIPGPGQIRNSNSYTLSAQVAAAGAQPVLLGTARDDLDDLRDKIGRALEHDIALVSGGVSMGKYDLVEDVFSEFGVRALFDKVAMKPGKPTVFGVRGDTFVFGLPGNPVSTIVSFHMFVRPLILSLLKAQDTKPSMFTARLEAPVKCDPERAALLPAVVCFDAGAYRIQSAPWKGSSDLAGLSRANALIVIPRREGALSANEIVQFIFLE